MEKMQKSLHGVITKGRALCAVLLCAVLFMAICPPDRLMAEEGTKESVTFSELNDPSVFLKQTRPHVCTLTSSAMMIRRAAMLAGNPDWKDITEASVRRTAWAEGCGLKWNFSSAGIVVAHKNLASKNELISMLAKHPEGVVIYNTRKPHAILITDYTDGVFYASDPSNGSPSGRYPVSRASISVESASRCWYVRNVSYTVFRDDKVQTVDGLRYRVIDGNEKTVECIGAVDEHTDMTIPDMILLNDSAYRVSKIAASAFSGNASVQNLVIGANVAEIGEKAFYQCGNMKTVQIYSEALGTVGADAFGKIYKKVKVYVKDTRMEAYAKLLEAASIPKKSVMDTFRNVLKK